ncbi:MAG: EAL domain-containing protein [Micavibrio sp.]|nr:EAL domain-containing protein [Micavibrio sp.]
MGFKQDRYDTELLRRIENLIRSFQRNVKDSEGKPNEASLIYGLRALVTLANMVLSKDEIFGIEPWHILSDNAPLGAPGEMLLRLKDHKGNPMPPYPAIMAFYENGYTAEIDGILFLAALGQMQRTGEKQISVNVSARSLRNPDFVKCTLERLESLELSSEQALIIEIHESTPNLSMNRQVLELYSRFGVEFAIDDVGLNMNDIIRLAEFDQLATYIKIDRHTVCAEEEASNSLKQVVMFCEALMPNAIMVAEGVQDAKHAVEIRNKFPNVVYAQGLYLPDDREKFKLEMYNVSSAMRSAVADRSAKLETVKAI